MNASQASCMIFSVACAHELCASIVFAARLRMFRLCSLSVACFQSFTILCRAALSAVPHQARKARRLRAARGGAAQVPRAAHLVRDRRPSRSRPQTRCVCVRVLMCAYACVSFCTPVDTGSILCASLPAYHITLSISLSFCLIRLCFFLALPTVNWRVLPVDQGHSSARCAQTHIFSLFHTQAFLCLSFGFSALSSPFCQQLTGACCWWTRATA